ncbi:hypothetical protein HOLleu_36829 [Holothuria leucospilota]|uniref:CCHC-type domain-containing protein n=2 Tax=Holothuria leucospilota TaxID=206669 RepID=A0A9Q0YMH6_HOLLE|nr:hypothetical protein HOLleu_36829 [Holothuria leucospilota]
MAELSSLNTHTQLNLDDEDNLAHNKVTEDSYAKIAQNNVPTVPRKRQVLIIGDSLLRDVRGEDFDHNVNVNCIRGATLKDIKAVLVHGPNNLQASSHVLIHVGTNDVANNAASNIDILSEYEDLITSCQVRFGEQSPKFYISGPCPRGDQHSQSVKELNSQLKELSSKLDCGFLDNLKSFQYGDGEIDSSLFTSDGVHLSRRGTQKLREKFTTIGPICLRPQQDSTMSSRPLPRQYSPYFNSGNPNYDVHDRRFHANNQNRRDRFQGYDHPNNHFRARDQLRQPPLPNRFTHQLNNNSDGGSKFYQRGCYNCGERNHTSNGCRFDLPVICRSCGVGGHKAKFCLYR